MKKRASAPSKTPAIRVAQPASDAAIPPIAPRSFSGQGRRLEPGRVEQRLEALHDLVARPPGAIDWEHDGEEGPSP